MQERLAHRLDVEVIRVAPEGEVGEESRPGQGVVTQFPHFIGKEHIAADEEGRGEHQHQRCKDAADAASVEDPDREAPGVQFVQHDPRDQIAGNHEEDVDSDEPAWHRCGQRMKGDDGQDRDGP